MVDVDRGRILGFRTARHHLDRRLAAGSMTEAAGAAGIQETDPGTAGISLYARVRGMTPDRLRDALCVDKSLMMVWAMRGAPYLVPTDEMAVFTTGSLPSGEESLKAYFGGWAKSLSDVGSSLEALMLRAAKVATDVLDGRRLQVDAFRHAIWRADARDPGTEGTIWGACRPSRASVPASRSDGCGLHCRSPANDRCRHCPCRPVAGSGAGRLW